MSVKAASPSDFVCADVVSFSSSESNCNNSEDAPQLSWVVKLHDTRIRNLINDLHHMHVNGHDPQVLGLHLEHCLLCSNFVSRGHMSTVLADAATVGWSKLIAHGDAKNATECAVYQTLHCLQICAMPSFALFMLRLELV